MKTHKSYIYLLIIITALWGILRMSPHTVLADGGGWPTSTSTQTTTPLLVVTQPSTGQDVIPATQTPATIEGAAPLPDAPTLGDQLLPGNDLQPATSTSSVEIQESGRSGNARLFITGGVLLVVILTVGFILMRLRS